LRSMFVRTHIFSEGFGMRQMLTITVFHPCFYSFLPTDSAEEPINLTAEFTVDGEIQSSASAGTMGSALYETLGLYNPAKGWAKAVNHPVAGEYRAIGLDLQGISADQKLLLQEKILETGGILQSHDNVLLSTLNRHDTVGDILFQTILTYFAENDAQDEVQAHSAGVVTYRAPSYGIFSTSLQTQYWFGIPRNTELRGLSMDVDALALQTVAIDNDQEKLQNFVRASGYRGSGMEHLVPERMFSTELIQVKSVSVVKALAIAGSEEQKIWMIDTNNLSSALSAINLNSDTEMDIRNSVLVGKVVTVHENPIVYNGWMGEGYIISDPISGAGAYKISGGENGSATSGGPGGALPFLLTPILAGLPQFFVGFAQELVDCVLENIGLILAIAAFIAILFFLRSIKLGLVVGGIILGSPAFAGSRPDDCGMTCNDHFTGCLESGLQSIPGPSWNHSACFTCKDECVRNGDYWPEVARDFNGSVRCDYWNF